MKKVLLTISMLMLTIISYADIIYLNDSVLPKHIQANKNDMSEYMCYGDCEQYIGRYVYLVNSTQTNKSNFFVKNFRSKSYINYEHKSKLDKYRLFCNHSFDDFSNKIYKVIDVRYIDRVYHIYIELTLMDVANPKNIFKYLNIGEFKDCPNNPFVDIAFYKYHQAKLNKDTRYKIRSSILKGGISNPEIWWSFKGIAYHDSENSLIYEFESEDNQKCYIMTEDVERSFDAKTVLASSIIDESTWQNYCLEKGEKYAQCKLERKVIEGMSHTDVQSIMGSPDGVLYNSRNIHDGWAIYAYLGRGHTPQWIEFSENKVSCVNLYKMLWDKGDVKMIEIIQHKLYH